MIKQLIEKLIAQHAEYKNIAERGLSGLRDAHDTETCSIQYNAFMAELKQVTDEIEKTIHTLKVEAGVEHE